MAPFLSAGKVKLAGFEEASPALDRVSSTSGLDIGNLVLRSLPRTVQQD